MGNCCAQGNLFWENSHQFIYQNETTGSEGKETKLYNQNKNPNLIRTIKEQAEIISEDDFETILQSNFPNLNRIVYPEGNSPSSFPPKNIFSFDPIKFPSGEIYKGSWDSNKKRQGFGISISADGNTLYKGNWESDKIGDFGLFLEKNGNYYLGQIKEGKFEGKGELNIEGISKYNGEFKNDLPEGKGIFEDYENNYKYDGDWSLGKKNGRGVLEFADGTKYEGDFKNNKIEGKGIWIWPNGDKYEGQFINGNYNGHGELLYKNGKKYLGEFINDKYDGKGKKIYPDGSMFEGNFSKGEYHGKGIWYYNNGDKLEGIWNNGIRNGIFHKILKNGEELNVEYKDDIKIKETIIIRK